MRFKEKDKYGLKDSCGKVILKPIYDHILLNMAEKGFIKAKLNNRWGLFDLQGKQLVPFKYDQETNLVKLYQKKLKIKEDLLK